ncbi:noggin-2-like [Asterias amurensis]|uniref:noggin-2-like n=1 Tax=Asterias amurensis TaxID=7602 RepID=UPI003AB491F4
MMYFWIICFVGTVGIAGTSKRSPSMILPRPLLKVNPDTHPTLPLIREIVDDLTNLPRPKDLNRNKLLHRLETEFDPRWMSVDDPFTSGVPEGDSNPMPSSKTPAWLLNELRHLNLSHTPNYVAAFPESRTALEVWLLERASCPVRYDWVDIGPLFWPPWVKHGTCVARQCSWPPGMKCVPGETRNIFLLRWHCMPTSTDDDERATRKRKNCRWIKVPYPVMSECICSCK